MNEYQISVSIDGKFLFRTEWDHSETRVEAAACQLMMGLKRDAQVVMLSRSKAMTIIATVKGERK